MIGFVLLDATPTPSYQGRKGPSWRPMQQSAYFVVMELMGNSNIGYVIWRTENCSGLVTWSLMKTQYSPNGPNQERSAKEFHSISSDRMKMNQWTKPINNTTNSRSWPKPTPPPPPKINKRSISWYQSQWRRAPSDINIGWFAEWIIQTDSSRRFK